MPRDNPEAYKDNPFWAAVTGAKGMPTTQRASGTMAGTFDSIFTDRPTNEQVSAETAAIERGRRFAGEDRELAEAEKQQALLKKLGGIYQAHIKSGHPTAMKMVIQDPAFFEAGGKTPESFVKLMEDVQKAAFPSPERPITVAENAALVTPGGEQLYRNTPAPVEGEPMELRKIRTTAATKRFGDISEDGYKARQEKATLTELATALQNAPEGSPGVAFRNMAAKWGVDLGDKTDLEVVTSLVDRLTPRQRVPGSGATSNAEMTVFKNSIAGLMHSRAGRQKILQGMAAIVDERVRLGDIADDAILGGEDYQTALARMKDAPKAFSRGAISSDKPAAETVAPGEIRVDRAGARWQYSGKGNPKDRANWVRAK